MTPAGLVASGSVRCARACAPAGIAAHTISARDAMSEARTTPPSVDKDRSPVTDQTEGQGGARSRSPLIAAPAVFVVLLLLLATVYHGAFDVREWAPAALLVLITLCALQISGGGLRVDDRWAQAMLGGIWLFAGWSLLSAAWAQSPALAWEGGARMLLYAGLLTIPIVLVPRDRIIELLGL